MKRTAKKIFVFTFSLLVLWACSNQDWDFPDFDYTTTYFPWQYPVRTLILGDYEYDNSNDQEGKFLISAAMGGVYENRNNIVVEFEIDPSLVENLNISGTSTQLKVLPSSYYTLSNNSQIIIPSGEFHGGVTVQLTDDFFNDSLAISTNYVIPMVITSSTTDSILSGRPLEEGADKRIAGDWAVSPKNFTIFGIKYINEYHGNYLLRGAAVTLDESQNQTDEVIYRQEFVERDIITPLLTTARHSISYSQPIRVSTGASPGNFNAILTFDDQGNCVVSSTEGFDVTGTGKFVQQGDEWGGKKRNVIHLNYEVQVNSSTYLVSDTLVFRDNGVTVEEFEPEIVFPDDNSED